VLKGEFIHRKGKKKKTEKCALNDKGRGQEGHDRREKKQTGVKRSWYSYTRSNLE